MSDATGNLLFYSDGITVYNRNHQPMPNGTGLLGNSSTSQSGLILHVPATPSTYYIFSLDANAGPDGLHYSLVDMSLDNGLGDVTFKNVPLQGPITERMTAVRHANLVDSWLVTHGWNSSEFFAYPVNSAGIQTPVISNVGALHGVSTGNSRGCMKFSPDGRRLAVAIPYDELVQLLRFDDQTGQFSNPITLPGIEGAYGLEFSPDGEKLYVSTVDPKPGDLYQFDLSSNDSAQIMNSMTLLNHTSSLSYGALQLAPDGKIYAARMATPYLGVIRSPNTQGTSCDFVENGIYLNGRFSQLGLPLFLQSYFAPPVPAFTFQSPCTGNQTEFFGTASFQPDSWQWEFGDPGSGSANFSGLQDPVHVFSQPGTYTVQLVVSFNGATDTVVHHVQVFEMPQIELGPDTALCSVDSLQLYAGQADHYLWSTLEHTAQITVNTNDLYVVEAWNGPCMARDSIRVDFIDLAYLNLGVDQEGCTDSPILLDAQNSGADYIWSTGEITQTIQVNQSGSYWVEARKQDCYISDTVHLTFYDRPAVDLGPDSAHCGTSLYLESGATGQSYEWNTGASSRGIHITQDGLYSVTVTEGVCAGIDSIQVELNALPELYFGDEIVFCPDDGPLALIAGPNDWNYVWDDGGTDPDRILFGGGTYWVLAQTPEGCVREMPFEVRESCAPQLYVPTAFSPNNDGLNDLFLPQTQDAGDFEMHIFDRWGKEIFATSDIQAGWDGKMDGTPLPEGVYVCNIRFQAKGEPQASIMRSTITLIR